MASAAAWANCVTVAFIAVIAVLTSYASAWNLPGVDLPSFPTAPGLPPLSLDWQQESEKLWQSHKDKISYCVGNTLSDAIALLQQSFPLPLLTDQSDSTGICSNTTAIYAHLCGPQEVAIYLKVTSASECRGSQQVHAAHTAESSCLHSCRDLATRHSCTL